MLSRLAQKLWGKFETPQECAKFVRLAAIFAFTIGVYWIINPTKDPVFLHTVGLDYLPYAKIFSLMIMVPAILLYSRLVDAFPRHRVFYALCVFYALVSCVFGVCMMNPVIGLANTTLSKWRFLGWAWYAFIESFGSIIVALFWSFAADTSTPDSAKRGFSIIALGAQFGGVFAPLAFYGAAEKWGPIPFTFIGAGGMLCIAALVFYFMKVTPKSELAGFHTEIKTAGYRKPQTGFFEGLRLIASSSYLIGIVGVVTLYEVVGTIIEFHLKTLAKMNYGSINALNSFFFKSAIFANGTALLCLLFGVGAIGRTLGLLRTLLLLPTLVLLGTVLLAFNFNLSIALLVFVLMRGLNYALNQPAKEQLYIPTTRESKYKAKAWIDMFGSRMAKGVGSSVHILRPVLQLAFVGVSSLICSGLVALWVMAALFVGNRHAQAVKEDKTIC